MCVTRVKGKHTHTHTHTHTSGDLVTCSRQASWMEESGIRRRGEWGQQTKRVGIGAVSWRCESVIIEHHRHIRVDAGTASVCTHTRRYVLRVEERCRSPPRGKICMSASMSVRIFMHTSTPTVPQPLFGTRGSPTVKVSCSSCHVKSSNSAAVHVKKAFLRGSLTRCKRISHAVPER